MEELVWPIFGFICGSLPFSVWLGRLFLHTDIRRYGDGNPGATNVFRAGGWGIGLAAYFLDISKGALPVGLARDFFGLQGVLLFLTAVAPALGHAFSPFLKGRGGKALAVIFGTWIGLTYYEIPVVILLQLLFWISLIRKEGWCVLFTALGTGMYLWFVRSEAVLLAVMAGDTALVIWKHRTDLRSPPSFRPWIQRLIQRVRPPGKPGPSE